MTTKNPFLEISEAMARAHSGNCTRADVAASLRRLAENVDDEVLDGALIQIDTQWDGSVYYTFCFRQHK